VGLIVSAQPGDGETYYEIAQPKPHHHLICSRCGIEIEVSGDILQPTIKEVRILHNFQIEAAHLVFSGVCAACHSE
jgi:Fe2+ or Zn2+ uptake regulation protein